jgi:hypothetical protein
VADPATTETLLGLPVVWSGIIAAGIALLGTAVGAFATNWGATKRLKLQLDHDTEQKAKERLLALRRELYLKAVDANVRGLAYFGTLPQADFTKPDADLPIRNLLAVGAQLQLVVNQGTVQMVSDVISAYGALQIKLIMKVMPMHNLRTDINLMNAQYDNAQAEIKRVLALMTQLNESGQRDPERFERLNRSFEFARQVSQEAADARVESWDQSNALQRQYMADLVPEMRRLSELQTRLLVELRRELDVGGDIEFIKRTMQNQLERAERAVSEFDSEFYATNKSDGSSGRQQDHQY